ncbi:MAG: site-specific integrase [Bacteroidota bacterium]
MNEIITESALTLYYNEHCLNSVVAAKESYRHVIEHLKKHFGNLATNIISPADVYEYCRKRREGIIGQRAGDGTLNRELNILITAIKYAVKRFKLDPDKDVPDIRFAFPKPPQGKDTWLTVEEMDRMLFYAKDDADLPTRLYRFCMIGFYCGQRKEAILSLKTSQIDLKSGIIDFNPPGRAQTKKHRPIVPIADELMPLAKQVIKLGDEYFCINNKSIRTSFRNLVDKCKFDKHITPHVLRHTYATQALQAGVDVWSVAGVMGDDPKTVLERYGHHDPNYLRGAVNFRRR